MTIDIKLREVHDSDLDIFFDHNCDPDANYMAAFTRRDRSDRGVFMAHWDKIRADNANINRTILFHGSVAGHIFSYLDSEQREVGYWLGREYWGRGIATAALSKFLELLPEGQLFAHAAKDNIGSIRVLQKCGFRMIGEDQFYSEARGVDVEEVVLEYVRERHE